MIVRSLLSASLALSCACATVPIASAPATPAPPPCDPGVVARVAGQPVRVQELARVRSGDRPALEVLLEARVQAAAREKYGLSSQLTGDDLERRLAGETGLVSIVDPTAELVVSHLWVKKPEAPADDAVIRDAAQRFYLSAASGRTFTDAFVDVAETIGSVHIEERETYPALVLPQVSDLAVGEVCAPFEADEGYHVVRIQQRNRGDQVFVRPLSDEERTVLWQKLYELLAVEVLVPEG